jgi:hypothetical protein
MYDFQRFMVTVSKNINVVELTLEGKGGRGER